MSDIVERLRNRNFPYGSYETMDKAAAEIERLNAWAEKLGKDLVDEHDETERLRGELHSVHAHLQHYRNLVDELRAEIERLEAVVVAGDREIEIARRALEGK